MGSRVQIRSAGPDTPHAMDSTEQKRLAPRLLVPSAWASLRNRRPRRLASGPAGGIL